MNVGVFYRSIIHLRPSMIYWRVHRTVKALCLRGLESLGQSKCISREMPAPEFRPLPELSSVYHCEEIHLSQHVFTFLNDRVVLPEDRAERRRTIDAMPLLWQFHYGYHDYLIALLQQSPDDTQLRTDVLGFMKEWLADFPLSLPGSRKSAWHAYVLSLRIESWIRLSHLFPDEPCIPDHIYQMTRVLRHNMEFGTMANHLMKNIKAMVLAGTYFQGTKGNAFFAYGMRLLERELHEQVLEDGAHFERSPMYHVAMLNDVLDMTEALSLTGNSIPGFLQNAAASMTGFLQRIIHPDGEVPYLNDSNSSFFIHTPEVLHRGLLLCQALGLAIPEAGNSATGHNPDQVSGLLVHRDDVFHLVFDGGNVGPDYQPGHAHCDTLSFELSCNARRMVTDTGVYHYKESPERTWSRTTAAHNTIMVDGVEQSEVWKSFRVGYRAKALLLSEESHSEYTVFHAAHNGYTHLQRGMIHERWMVISHQQWIAVVDILHGAGNHRVQSSLHFSPDTTGTSASDFFEIANESTQMKIHPFGFYQSLTPRELRTEYYPSFGKKLDRLSLVWEGSAPFPACGGYILHTHGELPRIEISSDPLQFRIFQGSELVYETTTGVS